MRAGHSIEVGPHAHDLGRVDGRAAVDINDEKSMNLQRQKN
jgi:hypothetical protein